MSRNAGPKARESTKDWLDDVLACIAEGKSIRRDLPQGGRLHIDRPLPFLCLYIGNGDEEPVAREIAQANASYLIGPDLASVEPVVEAVAQALREKLGAFLLFDIGELEHDRLLSGDAPFLQPFEVALWASPDRDARQAATVFAKAVAASEARFRTPKVEIRDTPPTVGGKFLLPSFGHPGIKVRFAPVYRQPGSDAVYPELMEQLIAVLFDAGLQAFASFITEEKLLELPTHRALGRKAFIDVVTRTDRSMDEVASTFDFLLEVTPINSNAAFEEFRRRDFQGQPRFLYRPLGLRVEAVKQKLFSISLDHLEDPVLYHLYREKQHELDLQLSMLSARGTSKFVEFGRALYGPVEPQLLSAAKNILADSAHRQSRDGDQHDEGDIADCFHVEARARSMIAGYQRELRDFEVSVEVRDDIPSGLLVSGHRLLISSNTRMDVRRVEPLLSHEVGVHLLTYFNGSVQGLRLFRIGLAGYEGMQEGLAVFAEFLTGGMTLSRLRLIAGRVVGCAAMLDGADFDETFRLLTDEHDFTEAAAFNLSLRLYRGGGLAKDAIYLRGLLQLLAHLKNGGALEPFWMGKIAASHFEVMQELALRGLLRMPAVHPAFLASADARARLQRARTGLNPIDMIQSKGN